MLDPTRHHDEFTFLDPLVTIAKFHAKAAFDHQEQLVFVFMVMEDELAFQFVELDLLAVELGRDVGFSVFVNLSELLPDVDLVHRLLLSP